MPKSVHTDAYASTIELLVRLRKERGVSQVELARRLGKRQQFISVVENRERRLDIVEFCVFVRAIGADLEAALAELACGLPKNTRI